MKKIVLRHYQRDAVEEIHNHWKLKSNRVILSLPTGGGKTETALSLMTDLNARGSRCLVIVDRLVLCDQWVNRMRRHGISSTGILQGSRTTHLAETELVVATAQTIASRGVTNDFGLIVIDECHYWHKAHRDVLNTISSDTKVIGLSATPLNRRMIESFDAVVAPVSVSSLISTGNLVPSRVFIPKCGDQVREKLAGVSISQGDYRASELDEAMRAVEIMGDVVREWVRLGENRPTIAFCVSVSHAKALAAQFIEHGVTAAAITQEDSLPQRNQLIAEFEDSKIKVLTSVNVLAVGFDSPMASCAIFARPTLSKSLHIQMAGRVIRLFNGKQDAIMLDHAGNIERHGRIESFAVPPSLLELQGITDKVARESRAQASDVTCESCGFLYPPALPSCPECDHKRTRVVLRVVEGELEELTVGALEDLPGIDPATISEFHTKALRYAKWMGFKSAWAFHKTIERFALKSDHGGAALDQLVRPKGQRDRSWVTTPLTQDDLDWLQSTSGVRLNVSLEQINSTVEGFQIDTGDCLGWQSISINRMRVDPNHCLKAIICAALAAKHQFRQITVEKMSRSINKASNGRISDVEVVARHMERKGVGVVKNGFLSIHKEQLPFSKTDRDRIVSYLGDSADTEISIPCERQSIFAGAI